MQHSGNNTDFLLVSGREVTDELLLSDNLIIHESFERKQAFIYFFFLQTVHFTNEVEILFGSKVIDQEAIIDESAGELFPVFAFGYIDIIDGYRALICLQ